jgi:dTDP-4-amino-4,6-dideoxygalactose transaminase
MDIDDLEKKITKKSSLILPVYYGGLHASIKQIQQLSKNNNLQVISDAAHACGTNFNKKKIGTEFDYVCFSFHPVKNLAMPKGGMIALNGKNSSLVKKNLNSLRWCGISDRKGPFYDITSLGYNYYMEEISASIGLSQLKKLNTMNNKRIKIARRYFKELHIQHKMPITKNSCYHLYWIQIKNREKFRKFMLQKGIETGIHYPPVHLMSLYRKNHKLPITEKVSQEIVTLPIRSNLDDISLDRIIKTINSYVDGLLI